MTEASRESKNFLNARLLLVCAVAASVSFPVAIVSIAKLALFLSGLWMLIWSERAGSDHTTHAVNGLPLNVSRAVLLVLVTFSLSLLWTTAESAESVGSIAKYGKLLTILLLPMLLRNRKEIRYAVVTYVLAQFFLVISSWLLFAGLPVPWATSRSAIQEFSVFSTYLDQGIMSAVVAAVCWHLRKLAPGRFGEMGAIAIAILCLANVLFALNGRSGHVVSVVLLSFALMWQFRRRYRWAVVILPALFMLVLLIASPKVQTRIQMAMSEVQEFSIERRADVVKGSSSGIRLHFWHRAIQSIAESPFFGSGVGSWSNEYNRLELQQNPASVKIGERGNPHQEYLQWGVQLGVPGILLFLTFLTAVFRDTLRAPPAEARAAQSVLVALVVACFFNSSIYDALIGDFFCVSLGLMLALAMHPSKVSPKAQVDAL